MGVVGGRQLLVGDELLFKLFKATFKLRSQSLCHPWPNPPGQEMRPPQAVRINVMPHDYVFHRPSKYIQP